METNTELYDIILTELNLHFINGETVETVDKTSCAKNLSEFLALCGYERKSNTEKIVAQIIYGSLYNTALSCRGKEILLDAEGIKRMAKDVYDIEVE